MPLYVGDYLADTAHLGALESGGYLHLIMHYWRVGRLPTDDASLARIAKMTGRQWVKAKPLILAFFDGDLRHKRIDAERDRANQICNSRRESGSAGGKAKALKDKDSRLANAKILPQRTHRQSQSHIDLEVTPKSITASALRAFTERFYRAYPKHVDPRLAEKAFASAVKRGADPEKIIAAAERFAEATRRAGTEKQFIKAPAVWLNAGAYDSEDLPAAVTPQARAGPGKPFEKRNPWFEMMENELKANGNGGQNAAYFGESAEDFSGETIELNASEFNIES